MIVHGFEEGEGINIKIHILQNLLSFIHHSMYTFYKYVTHTNNYC